MSDTSDLQERLARQAAKANQPADPSVGDVVEYVKAYAKQETLGPLKGAGSWLGYGFAASAALGLGLVLMLVGLLRLVQTEWDRSTTGNLSWTPYLIVLLVAIGLLVLTLKRIKKSTLHKEPK